MNTQIAFDSKAFDTAIDEGHGPALFAQLASEKGIVFDKSLGEMHWLKTTTPRKDFNLAMDVQPELVTQSSAGIPAFLATVFDPKVIRVLLAPMKAVEITGSESLKGDWTTEVMIFLVAEQVGLTSAYGDYSNDGTSNVGAIFPQRQNFLFQAFMQYGELELARAALAKLDWASEQQLANAMVMMKGMNTIYFFGVTNLQNYGLINDPNLPPPIAPTYSWLTNVTATANTIYQDILRLFVQLQYQTNGVVDNDAQMTLAMSPRNATMLKTITQYNTNSVEVLLKQNYPNLKIVTAPQYSTAAGELVQLICTEIEGQRTVECCYSSKLMAHQLVLEPSAYKQKRSSGCYGTIFYRPMLVSQMLG